MAMFQSSICDVLLLNETKGIESGRVSTRSHSSHSLTVDHDIHRIFTHLSHFLSFTHLSYICDLSLVITPALVPHAHYFNTSLLQTLRFLSLPLLASIYMEQKKLSEAEVIYQELVHRNPENSNYLQSLEECLQLDSEASKLANYQELASRFPRSRMIRKMPLTIATGNTQDSLVKLNEKQWFTV